MARSLSYCVPLLFLAVYLWDGIRALPGLLRRSVFTVTRRSTGTSAATPSTGEECRSPGAPGARSVVQVIPPPPLHASSSTVHGWSGVTWAVGEQAPGGPTHPLHVVSDDPGGLRVILGPGCKFGEPLR